MTSTPMFDQTADSANVKELIDRRIEVYGEPVQAFARIAEIMSGILGIEVKPYQVPLLMMAPKLVRTSITPDYSDNSDDIEGYLDIFRKIIGPDMIHARLASEYLAEKDRRADRL